MRFHDPWFLALLVLVPAVFGGWRGAGATLRYPMVAAFKGIAPGRRTRFRWFLPALRTLAFASLVVALARPQLGHAPSRVFSEGVDMVLAVDVSGSMLAEDFELDGQRANRLEVVKSTVRRFLAGRPGDRVGLVLFAGRPYTQCPLTLDHGWLLQNLDRTQVGIIEDGTAVGSALATAVSRLEASSAKSKVIVLLTDGRNNAGKVSPLTAAEAAKSMGYKVYTIGVGSKGLAPFPATDLFGNRVYRPVQVDIDEDSLKKIAAMTGGRYFRATGSESLEAIYAEIDELETTRFEGLQYLEYHELYVWLALAAFLALAGEWVLGESWLRVLP